MSDFGGPPTETPIAGRKVSFDFSDVASSVSGVPVQQGTGGAGYDAAKFGTPGFGEETPMVSYAGLDSVFKSRGVPVAENPIKMSFSAESQQLAHPADHIDAVNFDALAEDPSLMNTDTYRQTRRNLVQAEEAGQFKTNVSTIAQYTAALENDYFKTDIRDGATGVDTFSGPEYMVNSASARNHNVDEMYMDTDPASQALASGTAPANNKVPVMLGAFQHPNFANVDPAVSNLDMSTMSEALVDDATKLLSEGTPLMSTSAPEPKMFQIGLQTNPEVYWQRPVVYTHKKYYAAQPDGTIGYPPELQIPLPDPQQTFAQPYQPYAQDKSLRELNTKLAAVVDYDITLTSDATGQKHEMVPEYDPTRPPPVGPTGADLMLNTQDAASHNTSNNDALSQYTGGASNPATAASWVS